MVDEWSYWNKGGELAPRLMEAGPCRIGQVMMLNLLSVLRTLTILSVLSIPWLHVNYVEDA